MDYPELLKKRGKSFINIEGLEGPETPTSIEVKAEVNASLQDDVYKVLVIKGNGPTEVWVGCLPLKQKAGAWVVTRELDSSVVFGALHRISAPSFFGIRLDQGDGPDPVAEYREEVTGFTAAFGDFFGRLR